jgi:hypothetical protein
VLCYVMSTQMGDPPGLKRPPGATLAPACGTSMNYIMQRYRAAKCDRCCLFRRSADDAWRKEVHFFDQWPIGTSADYVNCFPPKRRQAALSGSKPAVFVDASPEYMLYPTAAPHVAQVLPQAKIVVLLRVRFPHPP